MRRFNGLPVLGLYFAAPIVVMPTRTAPDNDNGHNGYNRQDNHRDLCERPQPKHCVALPEAISSLVKGRILMIDLTWVGLLAERYAIQ
jgi:hypothetical protein